jgi:hypothetical protein
MNRTARRLKASLAVTKRLWPRRERFKMKSRNETDSANVVVAGTVMMVGGIWSREVGFYGFGHFHLELRYVYHEIFGLFFVKYCMRTSRPLLG